MKRVFTKPLIGMLAGAFFAAGLGGITPALAAPGDTSVYVYGITDFHGHIENGAVLASALNKDRTAVGASNSIFVSAGDNINASYFDSSIDGDLPAINQLKAMDLKVSAVGNHEFDKGIKDLTERVIPAFSPVVYVGANLKGNDLGPVKPYWTTTINGKTIAFIGAVTEGLTSAVNPALIGDVTVESLLKSVEYYATTLKDGDPSNGEADAVIALVHEGANADKQITSKVDGVVAGHTHENLNTTTQSGAPIVQADHYGMAYGKITLTWDSTGKLTAAGTVTEVPVSEVNAEREPTTEALYQAAKTKAETLGKTTVGRIVPNALGSTIIARGTANATLKTLISDTNGENRGIESTIGDLVANSTLEYLNQVMGAGTADIGVINAGGLRKDLDQNGDGIITYQEARDVLPFGNTNAVVTLTGAQVKTMLNQQWQPKGKSRPVLWLGLSKNITYAYEYKTDDDGVVRGHVFEVQLNGKTLKDTDTVKVCGNTFLLQGGDNFSVFTQGTNYVDTGIIDIDCFVDYLKKNYSETNKNLGISPAARRQSLGVSNFALAHGKVSFDVSGLAFSAGEMTPTYLHVVANGVDFGYYPVSLVGNVAAADALAQQPYAGQAHVEKTLSEKELTAFGTSLTSLAYVTGDEATLDNALATYVNFDAIPAEDTHSKTSEPTPAEPTPAEPTPAEPTPAEPTPAEPTKPANTKPAAQIQENPKPKETLDGKTLPQTNDSLNTTLPAGLALIGVIAGALGFAIKPHRQK